MAQSIMLFNHNMSAIKQGNYLQCANSGIPRFESKIYLTPVAKALSMFIIKVFLGYFDCKGIFLDLLHR